VTTTRHSARTVLAIGTATVLTLAGCGTDDDSATTTAAPAAATTEATAAVTDDTIGAIADFTITIAGFAFSGVTEVAVGSTVTITNTDSSTHTWSSDDGAFDSGSIAPGESFEFTFTQAGTFAYHCNFHPSMTGSIIVTG
jgi:plastocyanin